MTDSNCSALPCCSYATSKTSLIQSKSYCNNASICPKACKCSADHATVRSSVCSSGCSSENHRRRLEYLWKMESEIQRNGKCTCRNIPKMFCPWSPNAGPSKCSCNINRTCCDISRKFRPWSPDDGRRKCPSAHTGDNTHFYCNATDQNNLVARIAALRCMISKSFKWLAINLAIIFVVCADEGFPTVVHATIAVINFLNVCYYLTNLAKLYTALLRIELERPAYWTKNCLWERNLPQDLTRYFEVKGGEFLCRYWQDFASLVSTLRTVRSSPVGRSETERGMDADLRTLGDTIMKACQDELKFKSKFEDGKYRVPLMKRVKQPVYTLKQLDKYWRNYDEACEDEKVRLSKEQRSFQASLPCKPSLAGNQTLMLNKCKDSAYFEVVVPTALRCSEYQHSCRFDVHPSPVVATGSFSDLMKILHGKDYCSSLRWVANLKFWLSAKLKEVAEQFDMANCLLVRHGAAHTQIGASSIADLTAAFRQNEELLTFTPLLQFLSLTHNQAYLVWRYRVLASQPCLTSYCWQSGGDLRGKWTPEAGPCDSEIVLHFFCSYMDMKLPDLPFRTTKKRAFSEEYVILSDKPLQTLVEIGIVRQWVSPPHFNVLVKGRVYAIQGGSNNLFHALSYLIYCIKIYQRGKIGRVSLGKTGLDILWIVGDTTT